MMAFITPVQTVVASHNNEGIATTVFENLTYTGGLEMDK